MSTDFRLAVPSADVISSTKDSLRNVFPLPQVAKALNDTGRIIQVATHASVRVPDVYPNINNVLFDLLTICDDFSLLMTSFRIGAHDIGEALYVAYLYLLDGLPDMAFTKMDSLQTLIENMRIRAGIVSTHVSQTNQNLSKMRKVIRIPDKDMTMNRTLCLLTSDAARKQLDLIEEYCSALVPEIDKWLKECKEIAMPQMMENRQNAENMSSSSKKRFWNKLLNQAEVQNYLLRWKALYTLCEEYRPTIMRTKDTLEANYNSTPMPSEAIEQAWIEAESLPIANSGYKDLLVRYRRGDRDPLLGFNFEDPAQPTSNSDNLNLSSVDEILIEETPDSGTWDRTSTQIIIYEDFQPGTVSRIVEVGRNIYLPRVPACFICGTSLREKDNPFNSRLQQITTTVRKVLGEPGQDLKALPELNSKAIPKAFEGVLEHFRKDFGMSLAYTKLESSMRQYSESITNTQLCDIDMKPVRKNLKKLKNSVKKLLKKMRRCKKKIDRDLGTSPKYEISNDVKEPLEELGSALEKATDVVDKWLQKTEECRQRINESLKVKKKDKGHSRVASEALGCCRELNVMLCAEISPRRVTHQTQSEAIPIGGDVDSKYSINSSSTERVIVNQSRENSAHSRPRSAYRFGQRPGSQSSFGASANSRDSRTRSRSTPI